MVNCCLMTIVSMCQPKQRAFQRRIEAVHDPVRHVIELVDLVVASVTKLKHLYWTKEWADWQFFLLEADMHLVQRAQLPGSGNRL